MAQKLFIWLVMTIVPENEVTFGFYRNFKQLQNYLAQFQGFFWRVCDNCYENLHFFGFPNELPW